MREGGHLDRDSYDRAGIVNSSYNGAHRDGDWQHVVTFNDDGTPVMRELPWCYGGGFEEYTDTGNDLVVNFCWELV